MKKLLTAIFAVCIIGFTEAQVKTPAASTHAKSEVTVGMTDIEIDYSRPNKRGRVIFGELVPYGRIWRTGANASTTISFSDDVRVGGRELKAGKYALFTKPDKDNWVIYFYADTENWGNAVGETDLGNAVQFTVTPKKLSFTAETFTISIDELAYDSAVLRIYWDQTLVEAKIEVPTDEKTMATIDKTMNSSKIEARDYMAAANYYFAVGKDIHQAKEWMDKGMEITEKPAYYMYYQQALIYQKAGDKKGALEIANKTLDAAKAAGSSEYIKYAQDMIAELYK